MDSINRVYLDYTATTPVRDEVVAAMLPFFSAGYGNPSSLYEEGRRAKQCLEEARHRVAVCLGAEASEIFFTSGGTESNNWAIRGAALRNQEKGRHVITTSVEHHSVLHSFRALEREGFSVTYLPVDTDGLVSAEQVAAAIRPDTILVSVMVANNEVGSVLPVSEIAAVCRERKVLFHTDAVQAAGAMSLDVRLLGADLLSISGHKFYGPKGVGVLYVRKGTSLSKLMEGGAQERDRRAGTENLPGIVGLATALELAQSEVEVTGTGLAEIRDSLIAEIEEQIPGCRLNGHRSLRLPGNVNFSFADIEGESLLLLLDREGYACSSGSACASGAIDPSHVLLAMGRTPQEARGSLRISLGRGNSRDAVLSVVPVLKRIVERLRGFVAGK